MTGAVDGIVREIGVLQDLVPQLYAMATASTADANENRDSSVLIYATARLERARRELSSFLDNCTLHTHQQG